MLTNCACSSCLPVVTIPCCDGGSITQPLTLSKSYVLYNDMNESYIAVNGSEQPFTLLKKYTLPYDQLQNNGDIIEITGVFEVQSLATMIGASVYVAIRYDNVSLCMVEIKDTRFPIHVLMNISINRIASSTTANNLLCTGYAVGVPYNGNDYEVLSGQGKIFQIISKQFGTSPGLDIECKGYVSEPIDATHYAKCKQLCVKYIGI